MVRRDLALTPGAHLLLTFVQAFKPVCPCAGGNALCSSHFARGKTHSALVGGSSDFPLPRCCVCCLSSLHGVLACLSSGRRIWYWHPRPEPTGLPQPSAFPVESRRSEISRCAQGSRKEQGASSGSCWWRVCLRVVFPRGGESVLPALHLQLVFLFLFIPMCAITAAKFFSLIRKIYLNTSFSPSLSPRGLLAVR